MALAKMYYLAKAGDNSKIKTSSSSFRHTAVRLYGKSVIPKTLEP